MESTAIYWVPVWNVLAGQLQLLLANAQQLKTLPKASGEVSLHDVVCRTRHPLHPFSPLPCPKLAGAPNFLREDGSSSLLLRTSG